MPQLSIAEVRTEIMRAAGYDRNSGAASTAVVGSIFHGVLAGLMGPQGWQAALEGDELGDEQRLVKHVYEKMLGPRITALRASLRDRGAETLALWQATRAMCAWVCRVIQSAAKRGSIVYNPRTQSWEGVGNLCQAERTLEWEVCEAGWTSPVLVRGVADAVLHDPSLGHWCVVEYKLGQGHSEADLAQACLYHAMLTASGLAAVDGAMALFSFRPQLEERFFSSSDLAGAQAKLRALIGRLAGVIANRRVTTPPPRPPAAVAEPTHADLGKQLVRTLQDYGVLVQWQGEIIAGPSVLRFPVVPGKNVRKKAITDKADELQMQLRLEQAPFIQMSNGRLVIDVQRPDRQIVTFSSVSDQVSTGQQDGTFYIPLGVDMEGKLHCVDLASPNNPHLLVAGTSGSGKSEWLRMAIAGMILANTPDTLRLVLIDPKRSAFSDLKESPFLLGPKALVLPPEHDPVEILKTLIEEMERRYQRFSEQNVSDLAEYHACTDEILPRIVCICDEYADLIADRATKKEVETAISRLGAKARAAGIHLIVATQYPDRNTVGGALKMNLAGRVCLRTTNHIQSNMIINQSGAERLLGKGDLFFLSIGEPVRLQAPYLSTEERRRLFGGAELEEVVAPSG